MPELERELCGTRRPLTRSRLWRIVVWQSSRLVLNGDAGRQAIGERCCLVYGPRPRTVEIDQGQYPVQPLHDGLVLEARTPYGKLPKDSPGRPHYRRDARPKPVGNKQTLARSISVSCDGVEGLMQLLGACAFGAYEARVMDLDEELARSINDRTAISPDAMSYHLRRGGHPPPCERGAARGADGAGELSIRQRPTKPQA